MRWSLPPHHDYATTGGDLDASDHTSKAAVDRYTNTSPCATKTYQEEWWRALSDNIEHEAMQRWGELAYEPGAVEARLADLHQCELAFEAGQATVIDHTEQ
jgi:hypothetical protein